MAFLSGPACCCGEPRKSNSCTLTASESLYLGTLQEPRGHQSLAQGRQERASTQKPEKAEGCKNKSLNSWQTDPTGQTGLDDSSGYFEKSEMPGQ